eukprot:2256417-Rhodomonas_salina.1
MATGRVFLGEFPCTQRTAEMVLVLEQSVDETRMTTERVEALLAELANALAASPTRFQILHSAPTALRVKVKGPAAPSDPRAALQLVAETMHLVAHLRAAQAATRQRPRAEEEAGEEGLGLALIVQVHGPLQMPPLAHTRGVVALAVDWRGGRVVSVGEGEGACCVWRVVSGQHAAATQVSPCASGSRWSHLCWRNRHACRRH